MFLSQTYFTTKKSHKLPYSGRCDNSNEKNSAPTQRVACLEHKDMLQKESVQLSQLKIKRESDNKVLCHKQLHTELTGLPTRDCSENVQKAPGESCRDFSAITTSADCNIKVPQIPALEHAYSFCIPEVIQQ